MLGRYFQRLHAYQERQHGGLFWEEVAMAMKITNQYDNHWKEDYATISLSLWMQYDVRLLIYDALRICVLSSLKLSLPIYLKGTRSLVTVGILVSKIVHYL